MNSAIPREMWDSRTIKFRYTFLGFNIFNIDMPLLVNMQHVTNILSELTPPLSLSSSQTKEIGAYIPSCPVISGSSKKISNIQGFIKYSPLVFNHYFLKLDGSFDEYLISNFSAKSRSGLRRKVKKFTKSSGGITDWKIYQSPEELEEFHKIARAVSVKTYQERLLDSGLPESVGFVRKMKEKAAQGKVKGYILFKETKPIAFMYCPIEDGGVMHYEFVGFDREYRNDSPGTVLMYHALESLFASGEVALFDFGEGDGDHKQRFSTDKMTCSEIYFFRNNIKSNLVVYSHLALLKTTSQISLLLDKLNLKTKLRSWVR